MSGKSYTMREMKTIVEYLVEHRAYSETRGRKMWMDFAASRLTNRTWQSLKECFLKRILPDITNPYFKLDVEQIHSFKRGVDLTDKEKGKLEFRAVDEEPSNDSSGVNGQPSSSKSNNEGDATGEDTTCSKIVHNRASTETLILDNCYETAQDIQRELEKSTDEEHENQNGKTISKSVAKSVRDFIVYSEPLTPMLQEVLDDFGTDESDPPMEIDENYVNTERRSKSPENIAPSQSILDPKVATEMNKTVDDIKEDNNKKDNTDDIKGDDNNKKDNTHNDYDKQAEKQNEPEKKADDTTLSQLEDVMVLVDEALAKDLDQELNSQNNVIQNKTQSTNEASSVIPDTLLPNNQEAVTFENRLPSPTISCNPKQVSGKRKHSSSVEIIETSKKRHLETDQSVTNISEKDENEESKQEITKNALKENNNENTDNLIQPQKKKINLTLNSTNPDISMRKLSVEEREPSHDQQIEDVDNSDGNANNQSSSQIVNPCLKSVSLYAEQFSSTKYSDSDFNDTDDKVPKDKNDEEKEIVKTKPEEDVILLKSRSNSESNDEPKAKEKPLVPSSRNPQKDKTLANVFGFTNGSSHSRRVNSRKRTTSHRNVHYESSESSEWTSASDSEYVSPPRGRRNRYARKYLKPHSARVRCLEDDGGLFVMLGKKIYPLVRDGKIIKNYVSYLPESDPEAEDSYWKSKYVEEKKRTEELKKMIEQSKQNGVKSKDSSVSISPPSPPPAKNQQRQTARRESNNGQEMSRRDSKSTVQSGPEKTVKIKFTKLDQEVQLEGHWQHINPVLAQVVSMFHKEPAVKQSGSVNCVELSSGTTTPSASLPPDTGVQEKINKIESDIFKEIEEKDEEEDQELSKDREDVPKDVPKDEVVINGTPENAIGEPNVTFRKRRGKPKKESTPTVQSPMKTKEPIEPATELNDVGTLKQQKVSDSTPSLNATRRTRTPRKLLEVPEDGTSAAEKKNTRKSSPVKKAQDIEDEEILYKFPSPLPEKRRRKSTNSSKKAKDNSDHSNPKVNSPENISHHSANSSQGYQDSDTSPFHIGIGKRRRSMSTLSFKRRKTQRKHRSRSYPLVNVSESNISFNIAVKTTREQSSINSEVYKSDSYQFLMPRTRTIMERLQKIDETTANEPDTENDGRRYNVGEMRREELQECDRGQTGKNYAGSSSNISLPISPELSMVEDLTVSKTALAIIGDYPSIVQNPNSSELDAFDKYLMSRVDVTMPLMGQECGLRESYRKHIMSALSNLTGDAPNSAGRNLPSVDSSTFKVSSVSESILDKVYNADIEESDSLDKRLEQLLLESVQKPKIKKPEKMEVDTEVKKKGSRKRCSTPNKKQAIRKTAKTPIEGPLIEEECKAKCSRTGRRSCPPSINIVYYENNAPDNLEINIHDQIVDVTTVTKRKSTKKDVIKVKILKPKKKPENRRVSPKKVQNVSRTSGHMEFDNESGVFLQGFDDSADLIHNHSETCLQTRDCVGDSLECIEMSSRSIISVNSSNEFLYGEKEHININVVRGETETPELFCDDAQCAVDFGDEIRSAGSENTAYFTPLMSKANSILTEDLSEVSPPLSKPETRPSKWYLVSEEETNHCDAYLDDANDVPSYGANLNQIFPITCAIPDLSTITEMSDRFLNSCSPKDVGDVLY